MKHQLKINNLHVSIANGKEILHGVSLTVNSGEVHAVMGPNGGGKSTFAQSLMGHPGYTVTNGSVFVDNIDITNFSVDQKAKNGLFLAFQYPTEIPGVHFSNFLRMAFNEADTARHPELVSGSSNQKEKMPKQVRHDNNKLSPIAFRNLLEEKARELSFSQDMTKRMLNEGFSGGEKKKAEILQLSILKPFFAILDEPDSGLDIDSLKHISHAINTLEDKPGIILITHYQRILRYIKSDFVHVFVDGRIVESGRAELAQQIEENGYKKYRV